MFARDDGSTGHKFGNETPLTIQLATMQPPTKSHPRLIRPKGIRYREARVRTGRMGTVGLYQPVEIRVDGRRPFTDGCRRNHPDDSGHRQVPRARPTNERLKTDFYAVNGYSVQTLNTVAMRTLQAPHH